MGADIKKLRTRIKSVQSTLHLTKAMGLVASSKIRRATEGMLRGREYAQAVRETVSALSGCRACEKSPYMAQREGGETRLIVIAGDRGLAGGYNANVFRLVKEYPEATILPIGKRACDRFGGKLQSAEGFRYEDAQNMAEKLCRDFAEGTFDRLGLVSTTYHSMMSRETEVAWILPLTKGKETDGGGMIFEPDELSVLEIAMPVYVAGMIFAAVKESFACEVAARRVAMDSAGKNAQQMLDDLGLAYNRARQGAITQEITEIVAGSGQ
ncbi:MAG: ATP synthase F1 subunit gamma [Ruminococcaceae bacterium]|nr:ATP synthase F1 subunit gamma [Oscillospiraceae bacterium]